MEELIGRYFGNARIIIDSAVCDVYKIISVDKRRRKVIGVDVDSDFLGRKFEKEFALNKITLLAEDFKVIPAGTFVKLKDPAKHDNMIGGFIGGTSLEDGKPVYTIESKHSYELIDKGHTYASEDDFQIVDKDPFEDFLKEYIEIKAKENEVLAKCKEEYEKYLELLEE